MSLFVESAKSDLYKLYRPKKSAHDAPRLWWKYSILATIYLMRHSQRADLWTVVSHKNMDVLHNLRKALKIKSLMVDPSSLLEIFDENEAMRRLEREMEVLRKENGLLRQIVAKACKPSIIMDANQSLDYCQVFTEDGATITINLRDLLFPTDATLDTRTMKLPSSQSSSASASNSPIRAALTTAGLMFLSPGDSLNGSTELLPSEGATGTHTRSPARSTILRTAGANATSAAGPTAAFTSLNSVAPVSPYLDLSTETRLTSAKVYREEPEIMKSAKQQHRATVMPGSSGASSKKMTSTDFARTKRNATIVARANDAMVQIEKQQQQSVKSEVSPLKPTSSASELLNDSLSPLLAQPTTSSNPSSPTKTVTIAAAAAVAPESPPAPSGPTSYDLAVAAHQVNVTDSPTGGSSVKTKPLVPSSGASVESSSIASSSTNNKHQSTSSKGSSPGSRRSPPKAITASDRYRSAKVVPVSSAQLNKSEKVAFDIIVSAKRGGGGGGVVGSNGSAKAAATVALTQVEIALMKSPLSKEVVPKTSPPKDGLAVTKPSMMF